MGNELDTMKAMVMNVYDRLCIALTCYEACDENTDPDYDAGNALYNDIISIVDDMANRIN